MRISRVLLNAVPSAFFVVTLGARGFNMWMECQRPRGLYTGFCPMPRTRLNVLPAGTRPSLFGGD